MRALFISASKTVEVLFSVQTLLAALLSASGLSALAAPSLPVSSSRVIRPALVCRDLFEASFWTKRESPIQAAKGTYFATYSHDTEILIGNVYEFVLKNDPNNGDAKKAFDAITGRIPIHQAMFATGLTAKQLGAFALRNGVDANRTFFAFTDFRSTAMSQIYERIDGSRMDNAAATLKEFFVPLLLKRGLAVRFELDGRTPEIKHFSSSPSPEHFYRQIQLLNELIKDPQTHYHIGLPEDAVSERHSIAIARSLETHITLGLLSRGVAAKRDYKGTTFRNDKYGFDGTRGVVKLELGEFLTPYPANDLEVRNSRSPVDGLTMLEIASHLAERLPHGSRELPDIKESVVFDAHYGAAAAALMFAGEVLNDTTLVRLSRKASEASNGLAQDPKLLGEIATYIKKNDIEMKYDAALLAF